MARRSYKLVSLMIGAFLVVVACGGDVEQQPDLGGETNVNAGVELEGVLDIYSGRPPPRWTLRTDEVRQIRERIQGLSTAPAPENFPKLGELAILVMNTHRKAQTLPDRVRVGRGVVEITTGSTTSHFSDEKGLSAFLEESARAAGAFSR